MKTLLLCGHHNTQGPEVDQRIEQLRELGMDVVCVLAGSQADEILRRSKAIEKCELVFDTNDEPSLISNARAGAFALDPTEAAYLLPVDVPPPPPEVWQFLRTEYGKAGFSTPASLLGAVNSREGAPNEPAFPLLVTREGAKILQTAPALSGLVDPRLKYLHLPYQAL